MLWREHIGNRQRYHFPHRKVEKLKRKNADGKAKWVIAIFRFRVRRVERLLFALSVWLKCTTGFGGDKKVCRGELECAPDIDCHKFPSMRATIDFFNTLMLYLTHSSRFFFAGTHQLIRWISMRRRRRNTKLLPLCAFHVRSRRCFLSLLIGRQTCH